MVQFIDQNALQGLTNVIHSDLILDGKQLNSRLSIAVHSDAFWPFLVHWGLDKPLLKIQGGHIK